MNKEKIIAFDVDGTLIHLVGEKEDTPRYEIIDLFCYFKSLGCHMVIWSGGGIDYAKRWARKLGLEADIWKKQRSPSVDICFDDEQVILATINIQV